MQCEAPPCLVCREPLENVLEGRGNQPLDGLEFVTDGHYGSAEFDPMDGTVLAINVCDDCLARARDDGVILFHDDSGYRVWDDG